MSQPPTSTLDAFDPEAVDLAEVARHLRAACGSFVEGAVIGRTRLRDEVARQLECSQLASERLLDTMILRGFVKERRTSGGLVGWSVAEPTSADLD